MSTVADKLRQLITYQNDIKNALTTKGLTLSESDNFSGLASKINAHEFSGGGADVTSIVESGWSNSDIDLCSGATKVTANAFYKCSTITTVNFPNCSIVGSSAFGMCSNLTTVSFPVCKTIGSYAFEYCSSLTNTNVLECRTIEQNAFYSCKALTSINVPNCETIEQNAFMFCTSLTEGYFSQCTFVGSSAFAYCTNLSQLTVKKGCSLYDNPLSGTSAVLRFVPEYQYTFTMPGNGAFNVYNADKSKCKSIYKGISDQDVIISDGEVSGGTMAEFLPFENFAVTFDDLGFRPAWITVVTGGAGNMIDAIEDVAGFLSFDSSTATASVISSHTDGSVVAYSSIEIIVPEL